MPRRPRTLAAAVIALVLAAPVFAQNAPPAERVIRMSGAAPAAAGTQATLRFAIYDAEAGGTLLWQEAQTVAVDQAGQYTAFLGALSADGLPLSVFAGGAPRWLAVEGPGGAIGPRTLLAAVPYAITAATATDATTLAGRPVTDFQLTPAARRKDAASGDTTGAGAATPLVNSGSANFIGKFVNNVDLVNSQVYDNGSSVGLGTTLPLDKFHVQFTNNTGALTGLAVQNMSSGAAAYSGMLFYDHTGALRQFQGYNNSTGEYRINNIAPNGEINFMLNGESKFRVTQSGAIGLSAGNRPPSVKLNIFSNDTDGAAIRGSRHGNSVANPTPVLTGSALLQLEGAGYNGFYFTTATGLMRFMATEDWSAANNGTELQFWTTRNGTNTLAQRMTITDTGKVGIGTYTPQVMLDVLGTDVFPNTTPSAYFYGASTTLSSVYTGPFAGVSIRASGFLVGSGFAAISDARIKTITGESDSASDLATLRKIRITDYLFKDTVLHGANSQKKVVAQQVEEVYPQAVSQTTEVVPDIFTKAPIAKGWVSLATDLKVGDRVRFITPDGQRATHEVLEVADGRFRTNFAEEAGEVFVYGREVKDFRIVDYEAISMLNVSATQELARRLEQQTAENDALKTQNAALESRLAVVEAALKTLAASTAQRR
ncbi:MAG: tail fiber domain-containing protein [Vicinamibacterales bacterium]